MKNFIDGTRDYAQVTNGYQSYIPEMYAGVKKNFLNEDGSDTRFRIELPEGLKEYEPNPTEMQPKNISAYTAMFLLEYKRINSLPNEDRDSALKDLKIKYAAITSIQGKDYIAAFITLENKEKITSLVNLGVKIVERGNFFKNMNPIIAYIPIELLELVSALPYVKNISISTPVYKTELQKPYRPNNKSEAKVPSGTGFPYPIYDQPVIREEPIFGAAPTEEIIFEPPSFFDDQPIFDQPVIKSPQPIYAQPTLESGIGNAMLLKLEDINVAKETEDSILQNLARSQANKEFFKLVYDKVKSGISAPKSFNDALSEKSISPQEIEVEVLEEAKEPVIISDGTTISSDNKNFILIPFVERNGSKGIFQIYADGSYKLLGFKGMQQKAIFKDDVTAATAAAPVAPQTPALPTKPVSRNLTPFVYAGLGILAILIVARMVTKK